MPVLLGKAPSSRRKASSPPAEAPMPTIGKEPNAPRATSGEALGAPDRVGSGRRFDLPKAASFLGKSGRGVATAAVLARLPNP